MGILVACSALLLAAGCGSDDPGPQGLGGQLSSEQQRQDYVDGVGRALAQLGSAQGANYTRFVDSGNKRQLQASSLAWQQGLQQLKSLNPPTDAVEGHKQLVTSVEALHAWNQRIVNAAPNKKRTQALAKQASASPASQQFEQSVCTLVDAGFEVVDPGACGVFDQAEKAGPVS